MYNSVNEGFHIKEIRIYGYEVGKADYTLVDAALAKVPTDLSIYTSESVAVLQAAMDAVQYGLAEEQQEQVNEMASAIEEALAKLQFDKSYLLAAINQAKAMDETKYTLNSYTQLQQALSEAQSVYDTTQTSYDPIKEACDNLNKAITNMMEHTIITEYDATQTSKEGYLFAGYFEDEAYTIPTKTAENAYVKWIDEAALTVKAQLKANDTTSNIRFVSTVDNLQHTCVGFEVLIYSGEELFGSKEVTSTTVYSTIVSNVDGTQLYNDPTICSYASNYFFTFNLVNIPSACYDYQIKVTPYYVTYDGTKVMGTTRSISVNDVVALYNN